MRLIPGRPCRLPALERLPRGRGQPQPPAPSRGEGGRTAALALILAAGLAAPLAARDVVDASAPVDLSVTIYRDPDREADEELDPDDPRGLAMISETRRVTLPPGESTIRFEGVAEGMIGVSAIVTGLPGGTIETNRNAQLLSPAALVDGTLGNRVTITRTNPATGKQVSEPAVVRTRADGGLVLQTGQGFEAVQCSGLPETLTFDRVPAGLSAQPVFSVDTRSPEGGTYDVTLTYLSWGFDWQADYVGTMTGKQTGETFDLGLLSWLTLVNDNGQSFDNARLQIVAGALNIESDYEDLAEPPVAEGLYLTCYPLGRTGFGAPPPPPPPPPPAPPPMAAMAMEADTLVVTGSRLSAEALRSAVVTASEENLGDLKLYRVPGRVAVSAKAMKQVAFLDRPAVKSRLLYETACNLGNLVDPDPNSPSASETDPAGLLLVTKNETKQGLGIALPQGRLALFEPAAGAKGRGDMLAAEATLRDYASGQDVELDLGESAQVFARCGYLDREPGSESGRKWSRMRAVLTNANPHPVTLRLKIGAGGAYDIRFPRHKVELKNGWQTVQVSLPANAATAFDWTMRPAAVE